MLWMIPEEKKLELSRERTYDGATDEHSPHNISS